jgi:antiviral helicase SKI2
VQVLEELEYINKEGVVQMKGRVACELTSSSGHELLITELIFANAFNDLLPAELAAMLSSVVCQERRCQEPNLTPALAKVTCDVQCLSRDAQHGGCNERSNDE